MGSGGYLWWYVDGIADDGRHAFTLIAFVGSVFSPYYRRAWQRGEVDPGQYCAINLALYSRHRSSWVFSEYPAPAVARDADKFALPGANLVWHRDRLVMEIDERTAVFGRRLRGRIEVIPECNVGDATVLDEGGHHRWWPVAPRARFQASFTEPGLCFAGSAYTDANGGDRPLERDFIGWQWSRADFGESGTAVLYDVVSDSRRATPRGFWFDGQGGVEMLDAPHVATLRPTAWLLGRTTRTDGGQRPSVVRTLEDTPFYARSLVRTHLRGRPGMAVHESLDLLRFANPVVQAMLPYRLRRME